MSARISFLLVAIFAAAVVAACDQEPLSSGDSATAALTGATPRSGAAAAREAALRELLQALMPEGTEIAGPYVRDCSEVLPDPNCITVNLMGLGVPIDDRMQTLQMLADGDGWMPVGSESLTGGELLYFRREGYSLYLAFFREELYPDCPAPTERQRSPCRDTVMVHITR